MHSPRWTTCVTLPVQGWFKLCVSHCVGIATQTVVQHNYRNCYYKATMNVVCWCRGCSNSTCPCNHDCIPTCHWYNTLVVIKTTHVWTITALATDAWSYVLVTTLRTTSGRGPKPCLDLDFNQAIKTSGNTRKITRVCAVVTGRYRSSTFMLYIALT